MRVATMLGTLVHHRPTSTTVKNSLEEIAELCLCKRFHRATQVDGVIREWTNLIVESSPRRQRRERLSSSAIVSQSGSTISRDAISPSSSPPSVTRSSTRSSASQTPGESVQNRPNAALFQHSHRSGLSSNVVSPPEAMPNSIGSSAAPRTHHTHGVTRRPITEVCGICRDAIHTPDDAVWCYAQCGQNIHRECWDLWTAEWLLQRRDSDAEEELPNCVFCRAPWVDPETPTSPEPVPTPSRTSSPPHTHNSHEATRKPITEECVICLNTIQNLDDAVWCRGQCGQNVHSHCWGRWSREHSSSRTTGIDMDIPPPCVFCRAPWVE